MSLLLTINTQGLGTIWPASGVLLAALMIAPADRTGRYLLAAGIGSLAANLAGGESPWLAATYTLANMAEMLVTVRLYRLGGAAPPEIAYPERIGRLCLSGLAGAATSAVIAGVLGDHMSWGFLLSWFVTVALGMFIVTPMMLTGWTMVRAENRVRIERSAGEVVALLAAVVVVAAAVFWQSKYPLLFVPMLVQMIVTYRLGAFGATAGVLIVAMIASIACATGRGPLLLIGTPLSTIILFIQVYILALLASALPLATLLAKRDALLAELRAAYLDASRAAAQAIVAADTDQLTGLTSRRRVLADLATALERASETDAPLCVALLDVDHFKQVNDRYGHAAGDAVLRRVASAISGTMRAGDIAGRFGGEEFLIVIRDADPVLALTIAEQVRGVIEASARITADGPAVTVSIGVAAAWRHAGAEALIEQADRALYLAKGAGRNRIRLAA